MNTDATKLKVLKKLAPDQAGAKKLAQKYGDALVCVRHRTDPGGRIRYTTVELLVERAPIKPRIDRIVGVKIEYNERALQAAVRAAGARWDPQSKLWRMPRRVAGVLRLHDRIVDQ